MWSCGASPPDTCPAFASMGLRALCAGEEAAVDPARFSLEGRSVRKLRQSVHGAQRRGWEISAHEGREIDADLAVAPRSGVIAVGTISGGSQPAASGSPCCLGGWLVSLLIG